jgi:glutamate transport system permease protein
MTVLYDVPGPAARRRSAVIGTLGSIVVAAVAAAVVLRLQSQGQFEGEKWAPFKDPDIVSALWKGLLATLRAAGLAVLLALLLGTVLAVGRLSTRRWVRLPATWFVELFRAIPLVLLILFFFFRFGDSLGRYGALVAALALYNGSVLAEVFRAGISAVPRGQGEAAYAMGMRKNQVMRLILVPQAARIMLPAIVSQCVVALKDTALGFIISYEELLRQGRLIYTNFGNIVPTLFVIAALYIAMCLALSSLASFLERRLRQRGSRVIELDPAAEMGGGGAPVEAVAIR